MVHQYSGYCATVFQKLPMFRVKVLDSFRTCISSGYGYGKVTELTEIPRIVARAYRTHRRSGQVQNNLPEPRVPVARAHRTEFTEYLTTGMDVQNLEKFRVRV